MNPALQTPLFVYMRDPHRILRLSRELANAGTAAFCYMSPPIGWSVKHKSWFVVSDTSVQKQRLRFQVSLRLQGLEEKYIILAVCVCSLAVGEPKLIRPI